MKIFFYLLVGTLMLFASEKKIDVIVDLYGKGMLGAVVEGEMVSSKLAYDLMRGELPKQAFSVYRDNKKVEENVHVTFMRVHQKWHDRYYPMHTDVKSRKGIALPSSIGWDPFPRKVKSLSVKNPLYQKALAAFLYGDEKMASKVTIRKLWRVDIDGDGTDEVFIDNGSLIVMRKVTLGGIETQVIGSKDPKSELVNIMDVDGDGVMEVLLYHLYFKENLSSEIYHVNGRKPEMALMLDTEAHLIGEAL